MPRLGPERAGLEDTETYVPRNTQMDIYIPTSIHRCIYIRAHRYIQAERLYMHRPTQAHRHPPPCVNTPGHRDPYVNTGTNRHLCVHRHMHPWVIAYQARPLVHGDSFLHSLFAPECSKGQGQGQGQVRQGGRRPGVGDWEHSWPQASQTNRGQKLPQRPGQAAFSFNTEPGAVQDVGDPAGSG